ncbi:DUF4136 domain-containing protein [Yunchengibacter salinarum]|uniref:DUF4136 domain-containing protein n=1 Tax=Yunchengibacter salinarum TaxID=3133399 RepID=UPI0035B6931F
MQPIRHLALIAAALVLGACAKSFESDVATFHNMPAPGGKTIAVQAMDPDKQDSLEYAQYATVVGRKLAQQGFKLVDSTDNADLIAGFDVTLSEGRVHIDDRGYGGGFYGGYGFGGFHGYPYWGIGPGFNRRTESETVYTARLAMEIREPGGKMVFEGRSEAEVDSRALPELVPLLAESLFREFPGQSGITRQVKLKGDMVEKIQDPNAY